MEAPPRPLSPPARRTSTRRSSARSAASSDSTCSITTGGAAPVSNTSTLTTSTASGDSSSLLLTKDPAKCSPESPSRSSVRGPESTAVSSGSTVDLAAYYTFSKRNSRISHDETAEGLSGFLEYRKLNGTWRPFLFQTIDHQLVLYRVHVTHQVLVMSTDIRSASEIALAYEGPNNREDTRLLRLGINDTTITLRAVSHKAALHWVDGLQRLKAGKPLKRISDPPCIESEEEIFKEIDQLASIREWTPPPPPTPLCGLCIAPTKPEPPIAAMLQNVKKKALDGEASTDCRIC